LLQLVALISPLAANFYGTVSLETHVALNRNAGKWPPPVRWVPDSPGSLTELAIQVGMHL